MKKLFALVLAAALVMALGASALAATPDELTAAGIGPAGGGDGVWPLAAGAYDTALDAEGIPNGAVVFAAYVFDFATFTGTPIPVPASLAGYTKVSSISALTDGSWWSGQINGFDYVIVKGGAASGGATNGGAPAGGTAAVAPPASNPVSGGGSTAAIAISAPRTGDELNIVIWATIAVVAAAGIVVVARKKFASK